MSGFSSIATPGKIPTDGSGRNSVSPDKLFGSLDERLKYQKILESNGIDPSLEMRIKKVKVEIFDLSDSAQVKKYERLWKELLEKTSRMEVVVESHKDLVHRPDGTSYWMKYVEYVEFGSKDDKKK